MLETVEMLARCDLDAELFSEFPAKRFLGRFAAGKLATGKFPECLHGAGTQPVRDQ